MFTKLKSMSISQGLQQSLLTVFGNMGATLISAVAMILISRTLGPSSFGEFSVGFAIMIMLSKINDLGLSLAQLKFIPRISKVKQQNKIFSYVFKIKIIFALIIGMLGLLTTPYLAEKLQFQNTAILYLSFILNICFVIYEQILVLLQSLHKFLQSVFAAVIQAVFKLISAFILIKFIPSSTIFAFITYMAAPIVPLLFIKKLLPKNIKFNFSHDFKKEKTTLWKMAGHSAVGFIALGIIDNIDILFVQRYLDSYQTGLLAGASRIAMLFSLSAYSLSTVLNARVAKYQVKSDLFSYLKKAFFLSISIIFGYFLVLPFTNYTILFTIGEQYLGSRNILDILLGSAFITIITTPVAAVFFSFKRFEWYFSVSGILQLVLIIVGNAIFVPLYGATGAAWTRAVTKAILLLFTIIVAGFAIFNQHLKKSKITS